MFINSGKVEAELDALLALAEACECRLELVNAITHETTMPEPDAIKAGFIAGVTAAGAIATGATKGVSAYARLMAALSMAGKVYLEEHLGRKAAETDGVENG